MRTLLLTVLLIGGVAVAMPSVFMRYLERPARAAHSSVEVPVPDSARPEPDAPPRDQSAASRQVEIKAESDGHFYIEASVNFRPVRVMVDTGATVVALRTSDAERAGIRPRNDDYVHPVQTANGTTHAAEAVLSSISVDDIELRNIRALIVPDDQLSISLLGGSFLHGLQRFEVADGTLIFEN